MKNTILHILLLGLTILGQTQTQLSGCWKNIKTFSTKGGSPDRIKLLANTSNYVFAYGETTSSSTKIIGAVATQIVRDEELNNFYTELYGGSDFDFNYLGLVPSLTYAVHEPAKINVTAILPDQKNFYNRYGLGKNDSSRLMQSNGVSAADFKLELNPYRVKSQAITSTGMLHMGTLKGRYTLFTSNIVSSRWTYASIPLDSIHAVNDFDFFYDSLATSAKYLYLANSNGLYAGSVNARQVSLKLVKSWKGLRDFKIIDAKDNTNLFLSYINDSGYLQIVAINRSNGTLAASPIYTSAQIVKAYDIAGNANGIYIGLIDDEKNYTHPIHHILSGGVVKGSEIYPVIEEPNQLISIALNTSKFFLGLASVDRQNYQIYRYQAIDLSSIGLDSIVKVSGVDRKYIPAQASNGFDIYNCEKSLFNIFPNSGLVRYISDSISLILRRNNVYVGSSSLGNVDLQGLQSFQIQYRNGCTVLNSNVYYINKYVTAFDTVSNLVLYNANAGLKIASNPYYNASTISSFDVISNGGSYYPNGAAFSYSLDGGGTYSTPTSTSYNMDFSKVKDSARFMVRYSYMGCTSANRKALKYIKLPQVTKIDVLGLKGSGTVIRANAGKTFTNCGEDTQFSLEISPAIAGCSLFVKPKDALVYSLDNGFFRTNVRSFAPGDSFYVSSTGVPAVQSPTYYYDLNYVDIKPALVGSCVDIRRSVMLPRPRVWVGNFDVSVKSYKLTGFVTDADNSFRQAFAVTDTSLLDLSNVPDLGRLSFVDLSYDLSVCGHAIDYASYTAYQMPDTNLATIKRLDPSKDPNTIYFLEGESFAKARIVVGYPLSGTKYQFSYDNGNQITKNFPDTSYLNLYVGQVSSRDTISLNYRIINDESDGECFAYFNPKFVLQKRGIADLDPQIIGDSVLRPEFQYKYVMYFKNQILSDLIEYRWVLSEVNDDTLPKSLYKFISLSPQSNTSLLSINKIGKYKLVGEIRKTSATDELGALLFRDSMTVLCQNPARIVTGSGNVVDPNKIALSVCNTDTILCNGLYLDSLSLNELSYGENTCPDKTVIDHTVSGLYATMQAGKSHTLRIKVKNEFATNLDSSGAYVGVWVDLDNDGVIGEANEVVIASLQKNVYYEANNMFFEDREENIGERRMTVVVSADAIAASDLCELIQSSTPSLTEHFILKIESPGKILISSLVTPNGDGKNDRFKVVGIDTRYATSLRVINKLGKVVFHKDGYGVGNSTDDEENFESELKPDTYYYVFTNGDTTVKGFFELR